MPLKNVVARMLTADRPPRTRTTPTMHVGEADQAMRHAAFRHDGAGQHEKRNGQHRHLADAVGDFQHHRFRRNADPQGADQRAEAERIGNRHADGEAEKQRAEQNEEVHVGPAARLVECRRRVGLAVPVDRRPDGQMLDDEQQRE